MAEALEPTWHEARTAGRVLRHTEILRGIAHELSNSPDREDRPSTAAQAQARFDAHLRNLAETTPRTGLAAPTAAFIDDLVTRAGRYGSHLFVCFDDPRIPSTTNSLEGLFGRVKHTIRHTLGCGSTTNTVASNLGAEIIVVYQHIQGAEARAAVRAPSASPDAFLAAREELRLAEAPGIKQRSSVRYFKRHVSSLRDEWLSAATPAAGP